MTETGREQARVGASFFKPVPLVPLVIHRADGGRASLTNLKDYCLWHYHVMLHELGWELTVRPDGTSQVRSPGGKIIRSHSPPARPG